MTGWKEALRRVFCLPTWATVLIALPSFALVSWVLFVGETRTPVAYASYALSAYALAISVTAITRSARTLLSSARVARLRGRISSEQRALWMLYRGLAINAAYALLKLISGIVYHSPWFSAVAWYYVLLALMRFWLLRHVKQTPVGANLGAEWRRFRQCGICLLVMNQALMGLVVLVVHQNQAFDYPGVLIYAMAAYAFYAVIAAVMDMARRRTEGSPVWMAARVIRLVAALVSLLSLETALLNRFGKDDVFRHTMTSATGGVVCVLVLGLAVWMIWRGTRELRVITADRQAA